MQVYNVVAATQESPSISGMGHQNYRYLACAESSGWTHCHMSSSTWSSHNHHFDCSATIMHHLFPCHQLSGLLLLKGGHGIFNVCNDFSACCVHEGVTGSYESAGVDSEELKKGPSPCHIQQAKLLSSASAKQPQTWIVSCRLWDRISALVYLSL